ncbi:hypothetical protein O181_037227 [Austropuccinia psidii MF-1]|uniref:Retrovirus-related Pol polyprotein from transposon TNT 1-94-like beta-barrel domain-containing protein n=1 Tax=Austropuccinia psidii MF-1 TaxID=1389203 RepID=A0A9Q3D8K7_9BASI|nr:hypothetical protein [Austropuccinia psidii MF-1]
MWPRLLHLPNELILQILEAVDVVEHETLDEASSPFYWCLHTHQLPEAWNERFKREKVTWNRVTLPLSQINQASRQVMRRRAQSFTIGSATSNAGTGRFSQPSIGGQPTKLFYNHKNLRMFSENMMTNEVWNIISDYAPALESLTFDVQPENTYTVPSISVSPFRAVVDAFNLSIFPYLTSFTFRTASSDNWILHLVIRDLVEACPHLINLTVFHIHGNVNQDYDPELYGQASCQLKSLHLRRFRRCHDQNLLPFILSKSYDTLEELTLVLSGPNGIYEGNQRFCRGIGANEIQTVIGSCKKLSTLRIADQVAKISDYETQPQELELDPENKPLGFILDNLILNLEKLENLEISDSPLRLHLLASQNTIEELHAYIIWTEDDAETKKELSAQQNKNINKTTNRCSNNFHNPLAQHLEEDCWKLHPKKRPKNNKPINTLMAQNDSISNSNFVLDLGATTSMVNNLSYFQSIEMKKQEIELADGSIIEALGHGTIQLEFTNIILTFSNTLFIPSLATNIISMTTFLKTHHVIKLLNQDKFEVIDQNSRQIVTGSLASGNLTLSYPPKALLCSTIPSKLTTLHKAAGHPSLDYFQKMFPKLNIPQFSCITCSTCKMTKTPFSGNFPKATRRLKFLHLDLCGPIYPPSTSGAC